jgi:hypothetical protein
MRPSLRGFRCGFLGFALGIGHGFRVGNALQMVTNFFRNLDSDGTGVRFLFRYAKTGQKVNDSFRFDLEFSREFINADLR